MTTSQEFQASGKWTKPARLARTVVKLIVGAGGGGTTPSEGQD